MTAMLHQETLPQPELQSIILNKVKLSGNSVSIPSIP